MLSKHNFFMMMTMNIVVLILFLSSVVLKEYFNDYDVNHAAETEIIDKKEQDDPSDTVLMEQQVVYIGTMKNGYYDAMKEWAGYRKKSFQAYTSLKAADKVFQNKGKQKPYLLIDGKSLEKDPENAAKKLSRYVKRGGVVIFYRLPSYEVIKSCAVLQDLLGIQYVRAETVTLQEIRLYSGFLLGGETCYSFEDVEEKELVDMDREIPWYDISSRTKS